MDENRTDLFGENITNTENEIKEPSAPQTGAAQEAVSERKEEQAMSASPVQKEESQTEQEPPVQKDEPQAVQDQPVQKEESQVVQEQPVQKDEPQIVQEPPVQTEAPQTAQQKVDSFYNALHTNANGCTYAYAKPQQQPAQPQAEQPQPQAVRPQTYAPPVQRVNPVYNRPPVQQANSAYNTGASQYSYYNAPKTNMSTPTAVQAEAAANNAAQGKQKKEKKAKASMSFGQLLLCFVLCLVTGGVAGYVSSKTAVEKTLDSFMETFTTVTTTGSYNINIYEQQADTTAPTVQAQQQDDTTMPVVSNASASDIYKKNVNAVVNITAKGVRTVNYGFFFGSQQQEFTSSGSGFFLTEDGYILTNYHVVEDASTFIATDFEGNEYSAKLVGYEESNDIAVLKVSGTFQAVELGDSKSLEVGDTLLIIGNALGELQYTLTQGVVSYLERAVTTETGSVINMFQTDAAINSGNSGGPVFNAKGEVVGIASAKYASSTIEGLGFCIPIDDVKYMISDIVNVGYVTGKPSVGVSLYTNTSRSNGLPYGCYIVAVEAGSAADTAGLEDGDVITAVDGTSVRDVDDFGAALNGKKSGDSITLTVYIADAGSSSQVTLTLDEYVPAEARTQYSNVYDY